MGVRLHDRTAGQAPDDAAGRRPRTAPGPVPSAPEAPAPPEWFTGRAEQLARIEEAASRAGGTAPVVVAITGRAGAGKTSLAAYAAARLAAQGRFTDARAYADLGGHRSAATEDVAAALLRTLGMPGRRIPRHGPDRAALLRDRVAGRRTLLVLDDVHDTDQIRPLLPAEPRCLVLVTSRRNLVLDAGITVPVGVFSPGEALGLLGRIIGADRVAAEFAAAGELIAACGRLPLAVAVAGGLLRTGGSLAELARDLRTARERLTGVPVGERSVEAVLTTAGEALPPDAARLLGLLAAQPVHAASATDAAVLDGRTETETVETLGVLTRAGLLHERSPGRWSAHDLILDHLAGSGAPPDLGGAGDRLLDWYTLSAHAAAARTGAPAPVPELPRPAIPPAEFATAAEAGTWLRGAYADLLALTERAAATGRHRHAVLLDAVTRGYAAAERHTADQVPATAAAAGAAHALRDRSAEGAAHLFLGGAATERGRLREARGHMAVALQCYREAGDADGRARALAGSAEVHGAAGEIPAALDAYARAGLLFDALGDPLAAAALAVPVSRLLHAGGRDREAVAALTDAARTQHDRASAAEAPTRTALGALLRRLGRYGEASGHLELAVEIFTAVRARGSDGGRDAAGAAGALMLLGAVRRSLGEEDAARQCFRRALALAEETGARRERAAALAGLVAWRDRTDRKRP